MPDMSQLNEERGKLEEVLQSGSKKAKLGLARGLRDQAKFLRIQAAAGNIVSLILPATGKTILGVGGKLAEDLASSFDSWAAKLEKSAGAETKIPRTQTPGSKGDIEWSIMDRTDFFEYLKKIRPKNK